MDNTYTVVNLNDAVKLKFKKAEFDFPQVVNIKLFDENNSLKDDYKDILETVQSFLMNNAYTKRVNFNFPYEKLPNEFFVEICKFYEAVQDYVECKVAVTHYYKDSYKSSTVKYWNIETIIKANKDIEKVCDFIKESKFSPMEAFAYVHAYVQKIAKYNTTNQFFHNWFDNDQFFLGAYLDLPEIVCMGYSALMEEIINNLDMHGLECKIVGVSFDHLVKGYHASHARCFVKVKDEKYKIDQTFFDDATWDGLSAIEHPLFAHFAMSNDCHSPKVSELYDYYVPRFISLDHLKTTYFIEDFNKIKETYNNSKIKINQFMLEKIYFNVLTKLYPDEPVEKIYDILSEMTKSSFYEQQSRKYHGYIAKESLIISKDYATKLYNKGKNIEKKSFDEPKEL